LVLAPTGLGQLWIERGPVARAVRSIVRFAIARLRGSRTHFVFENHDDPREFGLDPASSEVTILGGAGVDPAEFPVVPEPTVPPVKVAVVSRMIVAKGIADAVEAVQRARSLGAPVELHLYGAPDPSNRDAISEELLRRWSSEPGITWHGRTEDVARVWREHHIALLLSYREGLPRTLLEAAAAGRPIIATDVPGCRELVRHRQEGLLVPPRDVDAAARALVELAGDPALRQRLGLAAFERVKEAFTEEAIRRSVGRLYRVLCSQKAAEPS